MTAVFAQKMSAGVERPFLFKRNAIRVGSGSTVLQDQPQVRSKSDGVDAEAGDETELIQRCLSHTEGEFERGLVVNRVVDEDGRTDYNRHSEDRNIRKE